MDRCEIYKMGDSMKNKRAVAMFGQKRLSREGGIEIVVKELCTRMARDGYKITCYNRSGHHVKLLYKTDENLSRRKECGINFFVTQFILLKIMS